MANDGTDQNVVGACRSAVTFARSTQEIRDRLDAFEARVCREAMEIADLFAHAKAQYDAEHGTGRRGKRNPESVPGFVPAMAAAIGRSESLVEKYLRIAKLDPASRAAIAEHPRIGRNLTALLDVASETDPEKRVEAVLAFEQGKPSGATTSPPNPLASRAQQDGKFRRLLEQFVDKKDALGGMDDSMAPPQSLVAQFPELGALPTVGALREAIHHLNEQPKGRAKRLTPADVHAQSISARSGKPTPITLRKAHLILQVTAVQGADGKPVDGATVFIAIADKT